MKKTAILLACVLASAVQIAQAAEGRAQIGAKKVSMCIGCHGIPGYKITFPDTYHVPKLGSQHADYIVAALKAYKSGERQHPTMNGIAITLSEQDMADIAAYYAGKTPAKPATTAVGKAPEKAATCAACHGNDGVSPAAAFPTIAGQHQDYLAQSLRGYQSGKRKNEVMKGMAATLTPKDIAELSAYFAAQKGLEIKR